MSGHSKWSSIKRKKGKEDAKRGQIFSKLARGIIVAAKEGGPNPQANMVLSNAVEKAKSFNMPNDNIERAIAKGAGKGSGTSFEHTIYEGYASGGAAVLVEIYTDNKNRTAADIRSIFNRHGGNLGTTGSVAWMFERKGTILVSKAGLEEDELINDAIEAGAEDVNVEDDYYEIVTNPADLGGVKRSLEEHGLEIKSAEVILQPKNTVKVESPGEAKKVLNLVEALEDHDDVQDVYSNFDIPIEVMETVS